MEVPPPSASVSGGRRLGEQYHRRMVTKLCTLVNGADCPAPISEDRLQESFHFLYQLEENYHDPRAFRFNLNALLAAIRSTSHLLQNEMDRLGSVQWWKKRREEFRTDPVLLAVQDGRNTTLHQTAILDGSMVQIGLFRGRRLKLAVGGEVPHDRTSVDLLRAWQGSEVSALFLDENRSDVGEQYGVQRLYFVKKLSKDEDTLTVCRRAIARTLRMVAAAHELRDLEVPMLYESDYVSQASLSRVSVLLETDVDPSLFQKWGW